MFRQHFWHASGIVRGHGDERDRHRALGPSREGARRPAAAALGRARARLRAVSTATSAAGRWRTSTRATSRSASAEARVAAMVESGASLRSSRWRCRRRVPLEGLAPIRAQSAASPAMRDAVGDGIDIMVDCHARPSPRMGHPVRGSALEPVRLYWSRGAVLAGAGRRHRRDPTLGARTPIATGERLVGVQGVSAELLEKGACSVLPAGHHPLRRPHGGAPDRRARRDLIASRSPRTTRRRPVSTAASIELGLATPSYIICEAVTRGCPWRARGRHSESHRIDLKGMHACPTRAAGPRDRDRSRRRSRAPVRAQSFPSGFYADGSVGELVGAR